MFALPTWTPVKTLGLNGQGVKEVDSQIFGHTTSNFYWSSDSEPSSTLFAKTVSYESLANYVVAGNDTTPHMVTANNAWPATGYNVRCVKE